MAGKFKGQSKTNNDGYICARFGATFYQKGGGSNGSPVHNPGRTGKEPTFWEFITAILETGQQLPFIPSRGVSVLWPFSAQWRVLCLQV